MAGNTSYETAACLIWQRKDEAVLAEKLIMREQEKRRRHEAAAAAIDDLPMRKFEIMADLMKRKNLPDDERRLQRFKNPNLPPNPTRDIVTVNIFRPWPEDHILAPDDEGLGREKPVRPVGTRTLQTVRQWEHNPDMLLDNQRADETFRPTLKLMRNQYAWQGRDMTAQLSDVAPKSRQQIAHERRVHSQKERDRLFKRHLRTIAQYKPQNRVPCRPASARRPQLCSPEATPYRTFHHIAVGKAEATEPEVKIAEKFAAAAEGKPMNVEHTPNPHSLKDPFADVVKQVIAEKKRHKQQQQQQQQYKRSQHNKAAPAPAPPAAAVSVSPRRPQTARSHATTASASLRHKIQEMSAKFL